MKANFKNFELRDVFVGEKASLWSENNYENNYKIYVKNTKTGASTSFDFWTSKASPRIKTEYDLLNAFYCFVSDAFAGNESFESFCDEFGYNNDSMKAYKTYKACVKSYNKFLHVSNFLFTENEVYEFINELQKIAG